AGAGVLGKSRSLAARLGHHGGGAGKALMPNSGGHRGPVVVSHLAHYATAPFRWASRRMGAGGGLVPGHWDAHGAAAAAAAAAATTATTATTAIQQDLQLSAPTAANEQRHATTNSAAATATAGVVGIALAGEAQGAPNATTGGVPGLTVGAEGTPVAVRSVRSEVPGQVQGKSSETGPKQNIDRSAGGTRGGGGIGNGDSRVCRPSPLRVMSGRDSPLPAQHSATADAAAVPTAVALAPVAAPLRAAELPAEQSAGGLPGDERV
ncbi:hypothetical protein Vretifemale_19599, partial [Volvox reticuliferus]